MIWVIVTIWIVFVLRCAILNERTGNDFYTFLLLTSIPFMFYIPFFFIK